MRIIFEAPLGTIQVGETTWGFRYHCLDPFGQPKLILCLTPRRQVHQTVVMTFVHIARSGLHSYSFETEFVDSALASSLRGQVLALLNLQSIRFDLGGSFQGVRNHLEIGRLTRTQLLSLCTQILPLELNSFLNMQANTQMRNPLDYLNISVRPLIFSPVLFAAPAEKKFLELQEIFEAKNISYLQKQKMAIAIREAIDEPNARCVLSLNEIDKSDVQTERFFTLSAYSKTIVDRYSAENTTEEDICLHTEFPEDVQFKAIFYAVEGEDLKIFENSLKQGLRDPVSRGNIFVACMVSIEDLYSVTDDYIDPEETVQLGLNNTPS